MNNSTPADAFANPWTDLSSKVVYENPWIQVLHNEVVTPKGQQGIYGKVCFKNLAIGIVPIDENGDTWLIGQYRYPLDEYSWEIPMGGGPLGLPMLASAQRELQEETGLSAGRWEYLMRLHTSNSVTDEVGHVFVAMDLTQGDTAFEDTEQLLIRKLPLDDAVEMVMQGEITDAISVAALLKIAAMKACKSGFFAL
jgi:8-oxo-dGTP pyrophosphatase MutT (NUDIX family)